MTPADEATFIQLWQQGASYRELAAAQRCPLGTVASRSASLAAQGKIHPRPRGGAKVRQDDPPAAVHAVVQSSAVHAHDTGAQTVQSLPEPLFEDPADNTTERWNLYLKHGLRVRIEAVAQARGVAPSRVVQELLWTALTDRQSLTP